MRTFLLFIIVVCCGIIIYQIATPNTMPPKELYKILPTSATQIDDSPLMDCYNNTMIENKQCEDTITISMDRFHPQQPILVDNRRIDKNVLDEIFQIFIGRSPTSKEAKDLDGKIAEIWDKKARNRDSVLKFLKDTNNASVPKGMFDNISLNGRPNGFIKFDIGLTITFNFFKLSSLRTRNDVQNFLDPDSDDFQPLLFALLGRFFKKEFGINPPLAFRPDDEEGQPEPADPLLPPPVIPSLPQGTSGGLPTDPTPQPKELQNIPPVNPLNKPGDAISEDIEVLAKNEEFYYQLKFSVDISDDGDAGVQYVTPMVDDVTVTYQEVIQIHQKLEINF